MSYTNSPNSTVEHSKPRHPRTPSPGPHGHRGARHLRATPGPLRSSWGHFGHVNPWIYIINSHCINTTSVKRHVYVCTSMYDVYADDLYYQDTLYQYDTA